LLLVLSRLLGAECQLVDAVDKLFVAALEREAKTNEPRALGDIDKSAGADDAAAQTRDIHVALAIDLAGAHERGIESPTVVEIKLAGMRDDRRRMRRDAEIDTAGRHATIDPGFDSESNRVRKAGLGQRRANAVARDAGANVHDVALVQRSNSPAAGADVPDRAPGPPSLRVPQER